MLDLPPAPYVLLEPTALLVPLPVLYARLAHTIRIQEAQLRLPVSNAVPELIAHPLARALAHLAPLVSITRIPAVPAHLHVLHVRLGLTVLPLALPRVRLAPRGTIAPPPARLHVRPVLLEHTTRT